MSLVTTTTTTTTMPPMVIVGACCVPGGCIISPEDRCNAIGTYLGDRTNVDLLCDADDLATCAAIVTTTTTSTITTTTTTTTTTLPGPPTGKCCTGTGACEIITEQACLASGGEYGGDDPDAACSLVDLFRCSLQ